jgi:hypothetical protein
MTVRTEDATRIGRSAARTSRGGFAAAAAEQLSRADRVARGKDARALAPLESHAEFAPDASRDPVGLLLEQEKSRVPELVPVRNGRMLVSPFTFYRGAALPMAADLATTPTSGLRVQLCGDAHLSNFGAFASPERRLVFDVNDFDETLPGPFEWDVKRLAASLVVAGPHLMQAESDIFLGWTRAADPDGVDRDYYVRQLKDWKFSAPIEQMAPSDLATYAGLCGWTLARAHARSGDRIALAAYLGGSSKFDQAIADFAEKYADQNDRDYAALQAAVKDGRAEATTDI